MGAMAASEAAGIVAQNTGAALPQGEEVGILGQLRLLRGPHHIEGGLGGLQQLPGHLHDV